MRLTTYRDPYRGNRSSDPAIWTDGVSLTIADRMLCKRIATILSRVDHTQGQFREGIVTEFVAKLTDHPVAPYETYTANGSENRPFRVYAVQHEGDVSDYYYAPRVEQIIAGGRFSMADVQFGVSPTSGNTMTVRYRHTGILIGAVAPMARRPVAVTTNICAR